MINDSDKIRDCIALAAKGTGNVSPNPLVGCIIISNNKIIGKGYHKKFGGKHAEINAINDAKKNGFPLRGSTMFVNLEPCSHFGKTPPCTDAIIREGIKKVYIGTKDPNPLINGKGISILRRNGINVKSGIIENECRELNKFYFKSVKSKEPYITLKIAQSLDGFIALPNSDSKWVTNSKSREHVQKLRQMYDAVLIGKNTCIKDNPMLNVRNDKFRSPYRIIIDRNLELPKYLNIFNEGDVSKTIIITSRQAPNIKSPVKIIQIKDKNGIIPFKSVFNQLNKMGIISILVEGGSFVFSEIIKQKLFDDILIFIAPKVFGNGVSAFGNIRINNMNKSINLRIRNIRYFGNDILLNIKK